jgi:Protein of unknown function (DUF3761)
MHFPRLCVVALVALTLVSYPAQTQRLSSSGSTPATNPKTPEQNCKNNGSYVNRNGRTIPRPENCLSAPQGATAQCRDGSYSFSTHRSGTCSHHGGVAKWL